MNYQPVGYRLKLTLGQNALDLGGLQWADVTGGVDGRVFHFRDPNNTALDFTVTASGRTLNMVMDGDEPWEYSDEEIRVGMLLAIQDAITNAFAVSTELAKQSGVKDGERIETDIPAKLDANYDHLRKAVKVVNVPTSK